MRKDFYCNQAITRIKVIIIVLIKNIVFKLKHTFYCEQVYRKFELNISDNSIYSSAKKRVAVNTLL